MQRQPAATAAMTSLRNKDDVALPAIALSKYGDAVNGVLDAGFSEVTVHAVTDAVERPRQPVSEGKAHEMATCSPFRG
jgi:hypothetical protein